MKLQTTITLQPEANPIDYTSKVLLLGSCFTENIGGRLDYFKFQNLQNPFGIIFNPVSIANLVDRALNDRLFTNDDVFEQDGIWHCFEVHSLVFHTQQLPYVELLNAKLLTLKNYLLEASHLVLTFGTSWVYRVKATSKVVANCHKVPASQFARTVLEPAKISEALEGILKSVQKVNPEVILIGTVSPVRHLKDGFVENMRSKSHLIAGVHAIVEKQNGCFYFPAYELMMDELRDYRFYTADLLHPNETAIEIIWERFRRVWISSETLALQKEIDGIQKGLQHRPFHPDSSKHREFKEELGLRIKTLQDRVPHVYFK